jgi:hypothetical protein
MYLQRKMVACSRNHCCNGNATTRSMCIVELHVTANNIKTINVAYKNAFMQNLCHRQQ